MTKLEAALSYASRGWKVFPCAPNTKIPRAGSGGVKDATSNEDVIIKWWTEEPNSNIGLACGEVSGVYVVDVDLRDSLGVNGYASITKAGISMKPTLCQKTPSGGTHCFYKWTTGDRPKNKNGLMKGVDIRGDGYYVIVEPSTINGVAYEFKTDCLELAEFPEEFKVKQDEVAIPIAMPTICTNNKVDAMTRARAYINEVPGAIQGSNGHGQLYWAVQVLVNGFRLTDEDVMNILITDYNPRCVPPWKGSELEHDFRHKISEARKNPNPSACSIYDSSYEQEEQFDLEKCIADVKSLLPYYSSNSPHKKEMIIEKKDVQKTLETLEPQGLVGDIARWITHNAPCPQPFLSLGASLALCGAVFGRKVRDESDGRTNIYCMGVGPSSCGKDFPGDCIQKILNASGASDLLMGRMTSDSAIERALIEYPSRIALIDEVGIFLSNIRGASSESCAKTIKPTFMELFSSAHKLYIGKEKAENRAKRIDQPCLCVWGVTVPERFYEGITVEELRDGWIARNLIFITNIRERPVRKPMAEVPSTIIDTIRAWYMRNVGDPIISSTPGGTIVPMTIKTDVDAGYIFDNFAQEAYDNMIKASKNDSKTQYLWGKAVQQARRIALIVSCGREFEMPTITRYDANYGCNLVRILIEDSIQEMEKSIVENCFEKDKVSILHIIEIGGSNGVPKSEIIRRTRGIKDSRTRDLYLGELVDSGDIVEKMAPGYKKPKKIYFLSKVLEESEAQDIKENGVEHEGVEEDE